MHQYCIFIQPTINMSELQNRRLAAILFADIAGYTALMQRDEQEALQKLTHFKEVLSVKSAEHHGTIIQYYGDGCLMLFESPVQAVLFALDVQKGFLGDVPVRMGIHSGDVVFREGLIFGDAVNITSRIESMGIPGSVLISQTVRDQIKNKPEFELVFLDAFDFKNVEEPVEIFALSNNGLSVPRREELQGKFKNLPPDHKRSFTRWTIPVLVFTALVVVGWFLIKEKAEVSKEVKSTEASIAIIPFRNLSNDTSQDYFGDGIVEAIYSKLAQVGGLRVTSMTSVLGYRHTSQSISDIAKELRVKHILEGSVSRDSNQVVINVRLVDADLDKQLWTKSYKQRLADIFAIQSNIAQSVVTALETTLTQVEQSRVSRLEVTDLTAYDLYLSGLGDFREYTLTLDSAYNESALRKAHRSIVLDPNFDEGFLLLARCTYARRTYGYGDAMLDTAGYYADQAFEINPSNSDVLSMKGWIAWDKADYIKSREYADRSIEISPNNGSALRLLALYYMHESESIEKSIPLLVKAIALNPRSTNSLEINMALFLDLGLVYLKADLLEEAEALFKQALELSSGRKSLEAVTLLGYLCHVSGRFQEAIEYRKQQLKLSPDDFGAINEYAGAHYAAGDLKEAEHYYRILLDRIEKGYQESRRSYIFRHRLAHILLQTGREEEAMELFNTHLKNEMADIAEGTRHFGQEYSIAGAYAAMGEKEKAYAWLEKMPFWYITYQFIRVDPLFKSLRGEDRYERLMSPHHDKIKRLQASIKTLEADGQLQLMIK
jgi:TolB-like protein/class 3 adenylate cyclase/tetratricopeptide (TPR) repeat protein